jgi:hypothetical protein
VNVSRTRRLVDAGVVIVPDAPLLRMIASFDPRARVEDGRLFVEQTEAAA